MIQTSYELLTNSPYMMDNTFSEMGIFIILLEVSFIAMIGIFLYGMFSNFSMHQVERNTGDVFPCKEPNGNFVKNNNSNHCFISCFKNPCPDMYDFLYQKLAAFEKKVTIFYDIKLYAPYKKFPPAALTEIFKILFCYLEHAIETYHIKNVKIMILMCKDNFSVMLGHERKSCSYEDLLLKLHGNMAFYDTALASDMQKLISFRDLYGFQLYVNREIIKGSDWCFIHLKSSD